MDIKQLRWGLSILSVFIKLQVEDISKWSLNVGTIANFETSLNLTYKTGRIILMKVVVEQQVAPPWLRGLGFVFLFALLVLTSVFDVGRIS